jgi:hypothetical protein
MEIVVNPGANQLRVAGTEGTTRTVKPREELDLTVAWSAGATASPPVPGTYSVVGRIYLKNSNVVEVALTYTVAG